MPILPLVDLLILMGTGSLMTGFFLKAIAITTRYQPTILGFSSVDFLLISAVFMGLGLVLVARTWMKMHEPRLVELQHAANVESAKRRARQHAYRTGTSLGGDEEIEAAAVVSPMRGTAAAD